MNRKLSMIPLKSFLEYLFIRGDKMKERVEPCPKNPDVMDTYVQIWSDDKVFYTLKRCGNVEVMRKAKEKKRY